MTIRNLIVLINTAYKEGTLLIAIRDIKNELNIRTGTYLGLFECKVIVEGEWHKEGNSLPGRRIMDKLKEGGYVGNR